MAWNEEAVEAIKEFVNEMKALEPRRTVESWTMPPGLVPVQTFPVHRTHFLPNMYKDVTSLEKC